MAINYDPAEHGGAAFGNADYDHLASQGHSHSEINAYISTLDNSQVSNKYKQQGGHSQTAAQAAKSASMGHSGHGIGSAGYSGGQSLSKLTGMSGQEMRAEAKKAGQNYQEWRKEQKNIYGSGGGNSQNAFATGESGPGPMGPTPQSSEADSSSPATNAMTTGGGLTDQYGDGLQGYANWWNAEGKQAAIDRQLEYAKNNPTAELSKMEHHDISLTQNGLFDWDSTKPVNGLDVAKMKEFGIQGGDKVFDPSSFKSINAYQGATTDGTLNAHYFAEGLAMPLRTDAMGGQMDEHNAQMKWNQQIKNAPQDAFLSSEGLYQDKYAQGYHGPDDMGVNFVGSDHSSSINQYINDHNAHRGLNDIREGINSYIRDGGYAGDALKILDGKHKQNLTSAEDIGWYNSIVQQAQGHDWAKENSDWGRDAKQSSYDVRAGGLSNASAMANKEWAEKHGGQSSDYWNSGSDGSNYSTSSLAKGTDPKGRSNDDDNWLDFSFQGTADNMFEEQDQKQNQDPIGSQGGYNAFAL